MLANVRVGTWSIKHDLGVLQLVESLLDVPIAALVDGLRLATAHNLEDLLLLLSQILQVSFYCSFLDS